MRKGDTVVVCKPDCPYHGRLAVIVEPVLDPSWIVVNITYWSHKTGEPAERRDHFKQAHLLSAPARGWRL